MSKLLVDEISDADNTGPVTVTDGLNVSSGNVGIGTSSPIRQLSLQNASNAEISILSGTSSNCSILMGDGTTGADVYRGYLQYNNATDTMLLISTGPITIGASGGVRLGIDGDGIKFNGDTAAANALDDYEEGTWTPVSPTVTFTSTFGSYTKIGNRIFVDATFIVPSTASGVSFYIDGFPFTSSNAAAQAGFYMRYTTDGTFRMFYMLGSGTRAQAYNLGGGATTLASVSTIRFDFSGAYYTT